MQISFRDTARFVWSYWRHFPRSIVVLIGCTLASAGAELLSPYFTGQLVDYLASVATDGVRDIGPAIFWISLFVLQGMLYWGFHHVQIFLLMRRMGVILRDVAANSLRAVQRFSADWHVNSFAGGIVTKIKRGQRSVETFTDQIYLEFLPKIILLTGIAIIFTIRWPLLGTVTSVLMLGYAVMSIYLAMHFVAPTRHAANREDTRTGSALADNLSCNPTVRMFAAEERENARFGAALERWRAATVRTWWTGEWTDVAQNSYMQVIKFVMLGLAAWLWHIGQASIGDVAFVLSNYFLISGYLRNIGRNTRHLLEAASDMEDVVKFSLMQPEIRDTPGATELSVHRGEIRFDDVTFKYPNQTQAAFENFSMTIQPGERVALVGHSGAGKSTFVKLVQRLYDVGSGRIEIDGQDIARVTQESLRRHIALVPQEPVLFHRTLAENIAYGRPEATMKEIITAARRAHADEFISRLPEGYDTLVGERGVKLSGGERQRVAIARAILADTPILILDEATSSLDSESERLIQDALDALMKDKTVIVVAHRLSTIKAVDRILVFEGGRIVEEGTHGALVEKDGGVYRGFFELQAAGFIG